MMYYLGSQTWVSVSKGDFMIPEAKREAVARALREAFGVTEFEDIRMMTAGLQRPSSFASSCGDVPTCCAWSRVPMPWAIQHTTSRHEDWAEAGLGPRVLYASTEDRISITDFVEARPFPRSEVLARLPATLRRLHALPPFRSRDP